ncbi:hypothetical protein LBMAG42_28490 [Deltaproteobacteria bacterium]|nr:hypothetical protein LBMAG42_28490 [Deltaproteobacteria bacterium]
MPALESAVFLLLLSVLLGCDAPGGDALADVDARYAKILSSLGAAERDTTRNVHNKDARRRKAEAEGDKVAFFQDAKVIAAIDAAKAAGPGTSLGVRGDEYARLAMETRAWTPADKVEETRLLGSLDEAASLTADWFTADGKKFTLDRDWDEVSREADTLDDSARQDLARAFVRHRMQLAGTDLVALVKLRNEVAKRAGYATYWQLALASYGLTEKEVDATMEELSSVVAPYFAGDREAILAASPEVADDFANHPRLRRLAKIGTDHDRAEAYFDADLAEERIVTAYRDMGFETAGLQLYTGPSRIVLPGVNGFAIQPPEFVAIVMSVDERWSAWPYQALIHEAGHAVWWMNLSPEAAASPAAWEPDAPWFEGFAQFFERVLAEPAFTAKYVPELPEADRAGVRAARVREVAEGIADAIVATRAERRLYENPDDLAGAFQVAQDARVALTGAPPPPAEGGAYDPALLGGLLRHYPAYSPNFLFAYLTEAQLWEGVTAAIGDPVANPKLAPFLIEKMVRQPVTVSFSERLNAIAPGDRAAALKAYLAQ